MLALLKALTKINAICKHFPQSGASNDSSSMAAVGKPVCICLNFGFSGKLHLCWETGQNHCHQPLCVSGFGTKRTVWNQNGRFHSVRNYTKCVYAWYSFPSQRPAGFHLHRPEHLLSKRVPLYLLHPAAAAWQNKFLGIPATRTTIVIPKIYRSSQ